MSDATTDAVPATVAMRVSYDGEQQLAARPLVAQGWQEEDGSLPDGIALAPKEIVFGAGAEAKVLPLDPSDGVLDIGMGSAVPGSVSVEQKGFRSGEWGVPLHEDEGGRLVETPLSPLPLDTIKNHGAAAGGIVTLDTARYAARGGAASRASFDVRISQTSTGYSGGETHVSYPKGSDAVAVFAPSSGISWRPGDPYGVATLTPYNLGVGLSDTHASIPRIDLVAALAAQTFDQANAATDRGVRTERVLRHNAPIPSDAGFVGTSPRTDEELDPENLRVRIVRTYINDSTVRNGVSVNEVMFDATYNLATHPILTELDISAAGHLDFDRGALLTKWGTGSIAALKSVSYRIVFGDGSVAIDEPNNLFPLLFVNSFQTGAQQTKAVPISATPLSGTKQGRMRFTWSHNATVGSNEGSSADLFPPTLPEGSFFKAYPAFRLRVWSVDGEDETLVYDTDAQSAPPRAPEGLYEWILPTEDELSAGSYKWAVSMLDAKFTAPNSSETKQEFTVSTQGS